MGTRGIVGVRIDGKDKIAYNHFDSYPEGLGREVINVLASLLQDGTSTQSFIEQAKALTPLDATLPPSPQQIKQLEPFTDLSVSKRSTSDWYCLLRKTQGDLSAILQAGLYEPADNFCKDSLFCEWGYIANLDEHKLEVYRGFQKSFHSKGRFAGDAKGDYYPIALVAAIPFSRIQQDAQLAYDDLLKLTNDPDEDEEAA